LSVQRQQEFIALQRNSSSFTIVQDHSLKKQKGFSLQSGLANKNLYKIAQIKLLRFKKAFT